MAFATGHALLIGVGTFRNVPRMDVPTTAEDARQVGAVLRDPLSCGYPESQVTILQGDSATRDRILAALDQLGQATSEDDTVLLFYSGHGEDGEDGKYYLTTNDMRKNDARKVVAGTAVRHDELLNRLRKIKAKRLLLIFNACHSGTISPVLGEAPDDAEVTEGGKSLPEDTAAAVLATGEGRIIITACRESQFSFVGGGALTIFGQALVDGLRGRGTISNNAGYISAFDLYTHLYYAVDRAVQRIPLSVRQRYAGGVQQPELTVIKGVGPFPVALYQGAQAALGDFQPEQVDDELAVSRIDRKYSERLLNKFISINIGDTQTAGRDIVHGDQIDARGSQGFINRASGPISQNFGPQTTVNTGGGDYAGGNIDKRQGQTFIDGDQYTMSGNFSGAILNIKSELSNVSQSIGALPNADQAAKDELKRLIDQLSAALQKVPADREDDAAAVAETAKQLVDQATKDKPNKTIIQITAEGLKSAAQNIAGVLPTVLPLATQIAAAIVKLVR
jgi:Caspase domain